MLKICKFQPKADPPMAEIQNSKFKIQNSRRGFTLIEMLVVVFVVGIGLIGALSFFNININNQFEAKNELIAAGLVQEGADLVRNIRDYNLLNSSGSLKWYSNLHNNTSSLCSAVDFNSLSSHQCSSAGSAVCLDANLRYSQCASGNTDFTRTISVIKRGNLDVAGSYLEITCKVEWNGRTTTAKDILYSNSF